MSNKLVEACKKSKWICKIYEMNPNLTRLCRYGTFTPTTYIINHEKKLAYIRVCKVANSSIKATMFDYVQGFKGIHNIVPCHEVLSEDEKKFYKFSFVRNPYERLVSCYVNKYISEKKRLEGTGHPLYMDKYLFGYIKNPKDFTEFVKKVCKIPRRFEDGHIQQQYYVLYDKHGNCLADYVGKYETIEEDFEVVREKFDLKPLPHYNKTEKGNWMDYFTLETAELVYQKYKKDFETFGYQEYHDKLVAYLTNK